MKVHQGIMCSSRKNVQSFSKKYLRKGTISKLNFKMKTQKGSRGNFHWNEKTENSVQMYSQENVHLFCPSEFCTTYGNGDESADPLNKLMMKLSLVWL